MLHARLGARAVEMRVYRTLRHRRGQRAVLECDVIKGGDSVEHTDADLSQGNAEGLGDATQLNRGLSPLGSMVEHSPPNEGVVWDSFHT